MKPLVYLGADHGGYALKEKIKGALTAWGYQWEDLGNTVFDQTDDYPLWALAVAKKVTRDREHGKAAKGILACRSAAGMGIVANKVRGIRAAAPHDIPSAILSRQKNDANILVLAADFLDEKEAIAIGKAWLETECTGEERHVRRLEQIRRLEEKTVEVTAGILENDFPAIEEKLHLVQDIVDWVHIDVADGALVPNKNFMDPLPFTTLTSSVRLEAHLMVSRPLDCVSSWAQSGFKRLIAHVEADRIEEFLQKAKQEGLAAGLAIDLPTDVEKVFPLIPKADCILVMAVKAGFSGQSFDMQVLKKIAILREKFPSLPIVVDGGMDETSASLVKMAGADRVVATSFIFQSKNIPEAIQKLHHA